VSVVGVPLTKLSAFAVPGTKENNETAASEDRKPGIERRGDVFIVD
jgi:hypothetical protein